MNKIIIHKDDIEVSNAAAELILQICEKSIETSGRFVIALSGGKTPSILFNLLAHLPYSEKLPWKKIFIFWSDERHVPADHPDNNAGLARKMLLDHVPVPAENIFPVQVQLAPDKSAIQYQQMLKAFFKEDLPCFDLILLGMGEDGHTASLFPGTENFWNNDSLIAAVTMRDNSSRITFTPALINNARNVLLLITGEKKSDVLKDVLENKKGILNYPVQWIKLKSGKCYWYLDQQAASKLKNK